MRKRYKLIMIIFISFILVIFIYYIFNKKKIIYVAIGDHLNYNNLSTYNYAEYIKYFYKNDNIEFYDFLEEQSSLRKMVDDISNNSKGINYLLKNADIITISIGTSELKKYKNLDEEIIINYLSDIYYLLKKIIELNNNIFVINAYNDNYRIINNKIKQYSDKLEMQYVNVNDIGKSYIYETENKSYLNFIGHKYLSQIIVKTTTTKNKGLLKASFMI